ncbi:MAG: hypothetical protein RJB26_780, partial [Pseudomonadota bacterium]
MHRDIGTEALCHFHCRAQFIQRVFAHVQRVVLGSGTATGHHLDEIGALAELLAGRAEYRRNTIGEEYLMAPLLRTEWAAHVLVDVAEAPVVTVTAGLRNDRTGHVDPGTGNQTFVDGALQAPDGAP